MRGYVKGTDVAAEITAMREAFARASAAILASPDPEQAFRDASAIGDWAKRLNSETANLRACKAAQLADTTTMSVTDMASCSAYPGAGSRNW